MKQYVTDTQCLLWYLTADRRLPRAIPSVYDAMEDGHAQIFVPSMVLVETLFLFQRECVTEKIVSQLMELSEEQDATLCVLPMDMSVVRTVRDFGPAVVKELADRVIAATARAFDLPLLTVDEEIIRSGLVKVVE